MIDGKSNDSRESMQKKASLGSTVPLLAQMDGWIVFNDWHLRTAPLAVVLELEFFIWTPTKLSQKGSLSGKMFAHKPLLINLKVLGHFPHLVRP